MDRYAKIKEKLMQIAREEGNISAIIAIGSSAREFSKADKYSDLDLIVATTTPENWLYGKEPDKLGNIKISFVERTLGGGLERRILFEDSLDVDIIVFTPEQLDYNVKNRVVQEVMDRGYAILYDVMDVTSLLKENIKVGIEQRIMSEEEFHNIVEDFWFHTIWASKKILRGELWTAKMSIDSYMKNILLQVVESGQIAGKQCDVWHNGRFFETWAEKDTLRELRDCFAHYDKEDMIKALRKTARLFSRVAKETAEACGYLYDSTAEEYAEKLFMEYF